MKSEMNEETKKGLWYNIHAKQQRIKNGSGEHMRKPGSKGAPTKADLVRSQNEEYGDYEQLHKSNTSKYFKERVKYHMELGKSYNQALNAARQENFREDVNNMFEDFYGAVVPNPTQHDRPTMILKKNSLDEAFVTETEAWQKKAGKNPEGGLNKKGIQSYRNAHPGSHLSLAVTKEPSKLKAGSKSSNRRKSFCARMKGMKARLTSAKTARDPDSRINKSLRKWNC
jgi:hypothetical protein